MRGSSAVGSVPGHHPVPSKPFTTARHPYSALPPRSQLANSCSRFALGGVASAGPLAAPLFGMALLMAPSAAWAACTGTTTTIVCTGTYSGTVGSGPTQNGTTVTVENGAQVSGGASHAITLGDNATITLGANSTVTNSASLGGGTSSAGRNTIEFGSYGVLTVGTGATVSALGSVNNGEPVNVIGTGNRIINYGTINSLSGAAIWFEDRTTGAGNVVDNYGTVTTQLGATSNVIGNSGTSDVTFINRSTGVVNGSLSFAGGNDNLTLEAGSVMTGSFDGGGGTNTLTLSGAAGTTDSLGGDIRNFQTLTKTGGGQWTLTGAVGANSGSAALQVVVNEGTLALTGNNQNFNGSVTVDTAGTLEARAQSLPPSVANNGLVRFTQDTAGTYAGIVSGSGAVEKTLGGVLTLTGANSYSGGTTINAGTISISSDGNLGAASGGLTLNGGTLASTADLATSRVTTVAAGGGAFAPAAGTTLTHNGFISGSGLLTKQDAGTLILTAANTYTGGTDIAGGTLQVASDGNLGATSGALQFNGGTLRTTADMATARATTVGAAGGTLETLAGTTLIYNGVISETGTLGKSGAGTLVLTQNNTYSGGTNVTGGVVQITSDANLGATSGALTLNGGTLQTGTDLTITRAGVVGPASGTFNTTAGTLTYSGVISGSGGLTATGSGGNLTLTGANTYSGTTFLDAGYLIVNGDQTGATGATIVSNAARLSGSGIIGGDVTVQDGGILAPGSAPFTPAALTINGSLNLSAGSTLFYDIADTTVGGELNDLTEVKGNLVLDGTIQVLDNGQDLGPGVYRIINYSGSLTNNGLDIGYYASAPGVETRPLTGFIVQTAVSGQVNLVNTSGLTLTYWDGLNGGKNDGVIDGGDGEWINAGPNNNWTTYDGATNAQWANGEFAIFIGAPGTVTVDNGNGTVTSAGMQFGVDGYQLTGGPLTLVDPTPSGEATIRVGDGTASAAGMTATIDADLTGAVKLVKTDAGTLILNGTNTYTGGTLIDGGVIQVADDRALGTASGALTLDSGTIRTTATMSAARDVVLEGDGGTLDVNSGTTLTLFNPITGVGAFSKIGDGTLILDTDNTYSGGTTIGAGVFQLGEGGTSGSVVGNIANNALLRVDRSDVVTLDNLISGTGALEQAGAGTTILTANNTYTGQTTISSGTLQLGSGGTSGSVAGNIAIAGGATLGLNRSDELAIGGVISGAGNLVDSGGGTTILTGSNSYTGTTAVTAGYLLVNGDQTLATGETTVASGARFGGGGIVGGNVTVADGGLLAPGSQPFTPGTLTINGDLTLNPNSTLFYNIVDTTVGGQLNDLTIVKGDLKLDGTIDLLDTGAELGPGVYRIIEYGGTLTDNGLTIGTYASAPGSPVSPLSGFIVQTAVEGQVNLVNTTGLNLTYWDGFAGIENDRTIHGGDGQWTNDTAQNDWTTSSGDINAPWADGEFAIFIGTPGTVTVDNTNGQVTSAGMQFGVDGYTLTGGTLQLVDGTGGSGEATIRVGDGTGDGVNMTATIDGVLSGNVLLNKTDEGTLILNGANTYTGGTRVEGGVLQISNDDNMGAYGSLLTLNGGTVRVAADIVATHPVTLGSAGGTIETQMPGGTPTMLTIGAAITGSGALTKSGTGTLVLSADNLYDGGTTIAGGILQLGNGGTSGSILGDIVDNAALVVNRSDTLVLAGTVSGTGRFEQAGTGTTVLTADNTYLGSTAISAGTLQLGNGGATGSIVGNVANSGVLAFDRSDIYTFGGVVSGTGALEQIGAGTVVLTGDSTYTGGTTITAGTLQLGNGGTTGSIAGDVIDNGLLTFDRSDTYTFAGLISGTGALDQLGSGTTILTSNNTFSGLTTISAGTLQLGDGGAAGSVGGGDIVDNGTLVLYHSDDLNYSGVISGTGSAVKRGSNTVILTGNSTYTGGSFIEAGTVQLGDGGTSGSVLGNIVDNGALVVDRSNSLLLNGVISGTGSFEQAGTGTTTFEGDNTYAGGTTISAGTLAIGNGGSTGSVVGDILDNGILVLNRADTVTFANLVSGSGQLVQGGLGTAVLTAANTYTGGTSIVSGTLQIASDGNMGAASGELLIGGGATLHTTADIATTRATVLAQGGGTFDVDGGTTLAHGGDIQGAGGLFKIGGGTLTLSGTNSYAGPTEIEAGTLRVNGDQSEATGLTTVYSGATLGGSGIVGGSVLVEDGGTLAPGNSPGTLAIAGDLTLSSGSRLSYEFGQADVAGGSLNDLTTVGGDLVLDGTIDVTVSPGGTFGAGVYRVFDYGGTLTDNGLEIGTIPASGYYVQTSVANQVNLVITDGLTFRFWDGATGPKNDNVVNGGDGVWQNSGGNDNWTLADGYPNAPFSDAAYAVFQGTAGTVTVDASLGTVQASGMQFMTSGYQITGDPVELVPIDPARGWAEIRVGDGTAAGAGITATIASALTGSAGLRKEDLGTLILSGANSYGGGTLIAGGVLQVSGDDNLGAAAGSLALDGGTLRTTASFGSARATTLEDLGGTFETSTGTALTLTGIVGGAGQLTKIGAGTLVLQGANGYTGGTLISAGTVQVSSDGNLGAASGGVTLDGGALATTADVATARSFVLTANGGTIDTAGGTTLTVQSSVSGTGALEKQGTGTLLLLADNGYSGGTSVDEGTLALGRNAGVTASLAGSANVAADATLGGYGSVAGDVTNLGTLAVADALERFASAGGGAFMVGGTLANAGLVDLAGSAPGNRLTVTNYVGQGGTIRLSTILAGDASPTDQLLIDGGTASGSSALAIVNAGGAGAVTVGNGIEVVVSQNGATTASNAFSLAGRVVAGPYQYALFRGGADGSDAESWFLRTERPEPEPGNPDPGDPEPGNPEPGNPEPGNPEPGTPEPEPFYRPEVPTYTALPSMALMFGRDLIGTLHDRVGDQVPLQGRPGVDGSNGAIWGRFAGQDSKWDAKRGGVYNQGPAFNADSYAFQIGADLLRSGSAEKGVTVAGLYGAFGWNEGIVKDFDMSYAGKTRFDAYSLAAYATHYAASGWYVDGVAQVTRYKLRAGSGYFQDLKTDGTGAAFSLETGYRLTLGGTLSIEPQAQLIYQFIDIDDSGDAAAQVKFDKVHSLTGRLGLRLVNDGTRAGRDGPRPLVTWLRANVWREFNANPQTSFSSEDGFVPFRSNLKATWAEFGAGVTTELTRGASLFASGSWQTSFGSEVNSWGLRAGLRFNW